MTARTESSGRPKREASSFRTFLAVLWRDFFVTGREIVPFLAQVLIQPFFILFIFGVVLTHIEFADSVKLVPVLLPGIVTLNGFLGALQNTALPLVLDFSWTREIEDRLLAPMPVSLVAIEKILFGAIRGFIAAVLMVPIGFVMLEGIRWPPSMLLPAAGVVALVALAGASLGMTMGTLVPPRCINIMFALILAPLMFTGATQFPWYRLHGLPLFQTVCALNPLTYGSEGMRDLLLQGQVRSIPLWIDLLVLLGSIVVFGTIGISCFLRRAMD